MSIPIPMVLVLDRALKDAGIPIDGVSIGDPTDRATWRAFYQLAATAAQRTQGDALLLTVDPQDATLLAEIKADMALTEESRDYLTAAIQAVYEAIPTPALTLLQVRNRAIALYKAKL